MVQPLQNILQRLFTNETTIPAFGQSVFENVCSGSCFRKNIFKHALDSLKTDMAAEGTMLHRGQSSNYECEVQYELSFLFNKWCQPWKYLCHHSTRLYDGIWYCEDAELCAR